MAVTRFPPPSRISRTLCSAFACDWKHYGNIQEMIEDVLSPPKKVILVESPVLLPFALCILPHFPRPQRGDGCLSPSTNSEGHEGSAGKGQIPSKRSTNAVIGTNSFGKSAPVRPTRSAVKHSHQGSHRRCSSRIGMRSARGREDSCEVCKVDMTNLVVSPTKATITSDLIAEFCCCAPEV